jgi:atlastin
MFDEDEAVLITHRDAISPSISPVPSDAPESPAAAAEQTELPTAAVEAREVMEPEPTAEPVKSPDATTEPSSDPRNESTDPSEPLLADIPSALQIVSIGTASDAFAFTFHEEQLNSILSKIPAGWKVCVVSVVGAFRTGKSFLLSWFLRYLETKCVNPSSGDGDGRKWYERVQTLNQHEGSFDWRGGTARNTTGMWMWSDPYFLPRDDGGDVAVLLVDTQGMFDHETTVGLTAAIFGLSTLLSSYQIYNVDKRVQEDNLQQLALFSEYGRMALEAEERAKGKVSKDKESDKEKVDAKAPFQKIEFLVRDWQNFDTEDETDIASMETEMTSYLQHVLAERAATDLKETRDQIHSCFEEVSCFMMTHPGFAVVKNKYEGDVNKIERQFLTLLDRYCQRVFDTTGSETCPPRLQPKTVRGRELSAVELGTYIKSYAQMFEQIGAHFPKAETMFEATARANNTNAMAAGMEAYTNLMNEVAGPQAHDYHRPEEMEVKHREASEKALKAFDDMANFGNRKAIEEARDLVLKKIDKDYQVFVSLNDGRNPLLGFET